MRFVVWLSLLTIFVTAKADDKVPAALQRAKALQAKFEKDNAADVAYLANELNALTSKMKDIELQAFEKTLNEKLEADKKVLVEIKAKFAEKVAADRKKDSGSPYYFEASSSMGKLIGTPTYSGILDDAAQLLKKPGLAEVSKLQLKNNQTTVVKTLLLYALTIARNETSVNEKVLENLTLVYPANLPELDKALLAKCLLFANGKLYAPNAGFVFGGNFFKDKCRGLDCSSFVAHCVECDVRLTTMLLEYIWREIKHGEKAFSDKEKAIREEFIREYKLTDLAKKFTIVDPEKERLLPGDIVTWRIPNKKTNTKSGHTVIYVQPSEKDENLFTAVEDNREDDKSKEGILVSEFKLRRDEAELYVLRYKN